MFQSTFFSYDKTRSKKQSNTLHTYEYARKRVRALHSELQNGKTSRRRKNSKQGRNYPVRNHTNITLNLSNSLVNGRTTHNNYFTILDDYDEYEDYELWTDPESPPSIPIPTPILNQIDSDNAEPGSMYITPTVLEYARGDFLFEDIDYEHDAITEKHNFDAGCRIV